MKILWLTWRDRQHPRAGGAEVVNEELAKRLARDGHEVRFVVGGFPGAVPEETRDGFNIVRLGGRFSIYWKAYRHYKKHLRDWPDLVIDEMNTVPFFAKSYVRQKNVMFVHQLCREIWFYEMFFPLSLVGYLLEPLYLWLLSNREVITVSESSKRNLMRFGFKSKKIHVIGEGIELEPAKNIDGIEKYDTPTILAFGALRPMKRTHHVVKAFELLRCTMPNARLIVAGEAEGGYGKRVLARAKSSTFAADIECLGKVDMRKKIELLQKSHVLAVTSVKEGWGLVITEGNSQGTPAVVYDVDGLRDSVKNGETGIVVSENNPAALASALARLLGDSAQYKAMQKKAWEWSKEITFDKSYRQLADLLKYV